MSTAVEPDGANAEQVRYWNDVAGQKWVALAPLVDAQIRPLGQRAMDAGGIAAGEHVLDVGCGCGDTSLELARRTAAGGTVTGIDVSAVMLARARERGADQPGLRFIEGDVQTYAFPPAAADVVFSRFGIMFFSDPTAAFANIARGLRPGGRLAFVCWQPLERNPWMRVPLTAAAAHLPLPPPPGPEAPGPFSFGDPERVRRILAGAGFAAVALTAHDEMLSVGGGGDLDATVDFLLRMGPTGALLRQAPPDVHPAVAAAVREAVAPFAGAGGVRMPGAVWIVTARRP